MPGVRDTADLAGLPLLSAALSVFMFLATPIRNTIIRTAERWKAEHQWERRPTAPRRDNPAARVRVRRAASSTS